MGAVCPVSVAATCAVPAVALSIAERIGSVCTAPQANAPAVVNVAAAMNARRRVKNPCDSALMASINAIAIRPRDAAAR